MAKQSEKKLQRLMEKAQELFLKNGYKNVSIDQIANETGISKMTIYKYYPSKEDLFIEAIISYSNNALDIIRKMLEEKQHTLEKLELLYTYSIESSKDINNELYKDIFDRPYILEKLMAYKREVSKMLWAELLQDGIEKGEIRKLNVEFVGNILMDMPNLFLKSEQLFDEKNRKELIANMFDFMKYGLLGGLDEPQK